MRGLKNNDLDTLTDLLTDVIFGKGLTFNVQSMPSVLTMAVAIGVCFSEDAVHWLKGIGYLQHIDTIKIKA